MSIALITGSSGLIGSESCRFFHEKGFDIHGIDNNLREYFFGTGSSITWNTERLRSSLKRFTQYPIDIRDEESVFGLFGKLGKNISIVIHAAAQPSHDWAAREPITDFTVNANGTLVMLEATRRFCPDAVFINMSTNKVYGDTPNLLPLVELDTRWECDPSHPFSRYGIDESMSIDQTRHSLFGASKVAADVMAQEYGRYFGLRTVTFRGGCLTGPAHSGAELHGFLAYLIKCVVTGKKYTVFGYKGKQVRDNIHSYDLVNAFWSYFQDPRIGEVYNLGGGRFSNCSMIEAIRMSEEIAERVLEYELIETNRMGDHIWWISDLRKFQRHYPSWQLKYSIQEIVSQIVDAAKETNRTS